MLTYITPIITPAMKERIKGIETLGRKRYHAAKMKNTRIATSAVARHHRFLMMSLGAKLGFTYEKKIRYDRPKNSPPRNTKM